jgi:hypothetical protein
MPKVNLRKIMRRLSMILLFFLVTACSDGSESPATSVDQRNSPAIAADDTPIVDNEDLSPELKGIDADRNGIRDDIDRFIARHYSTTSTMRKVAEREARAFQKQLDVTTYDQAIAAGNDVSMAADCTFYLLPHATEKDRKFAEDLSIEIKALTANTRERFEAYWHAQEMLSGSVFKDVKDPVCD